MTRQFNLNQPRHWYDLRAFFTHFAYSKHVPAEEATASDHYHFGLSNFEPILGMKLEFINSVDRPKLEANQIVAYFGHHLSIIAFNCNHSQRAMVYKNH